MPSHAPGNLSNRATPVNKLDERQLNCAQRHPPVRHDDFVARHTGTRSHYRDVVESFLCGEVDGVVLLGSVGAARHEVVAP